MAVVEKPRPSWRPHLWPAQLPSSSDVTAWLVSATVHFAVLVIMASITLLLPIQQRVLLSAFPLPELEEEPLKAQDFHFSVDPQEHVGALGAGELGTARPVAPTEAELSELSYELDPTTTIGEIEVRDFDRTVLEGPVLPDNVIVKGAGSVGTSGAVGAVDRITHEILLSLDERPTLVVWLFDRSGSLKPQRESIAKRFDRVYEELGIIEAGGNAAFERHREKPLLTAVAQFGTAVELITPKPIDDLTEIKAAVRAVSDERAGDRPRECVSVRGLRGRKVSAPSARPTAKKRHDCRVHR